jgi:hypothetical protein
MGYWHGRKSISVMKNYSFRANFRRVDEQKSLFCIVFIIQLLHCGADIITIGLLFLLAKNIF